MKIYNISNGVNVTVDKCCYLYLITVGKLNREKNTLAFNKLLRLDRAIGLFKEIFQKGKDTNAIQRESKEIIVAYLLIINFLRAFMP